MPRFHTYVFAKVMNLPMDFFERTQVGKIAYDMNQVFRIRSFLVGQLFGTVLDSTTLVVFYSGDVVLQSNDDGGCRWPGRTDCGLADRMAAGLPKEIERGRGGGIGKGRVSGAELVRRPYGKITGARCPPATHLGCARRAGYEAAFCRRHDGQLDAGRCATAGAIGRQRRVRRRRLLCAHDQRYGLRRCAVCVPDVVAAGDRAVDANGAARESV